MLDFKDLYKLYMYILILFNLLVMLSVISFYTKQYEILGILLVLLYTVWYKHNKKEINF